jgi:hypothetical protein
MDAQGLYGLPLDRFVAERTALAKALRSEGRREEAADVAGLRKPSVAAWAVNQLVRTQGRDISVLFDAGDELRRAQSELLAGRGDAATMRAVVDRERAAVDVLIAAARGLLSTDGHEPSATAIERVADTLDAAALDEDARAQIRDGCLIGELRHVGFGAQSPGETAPSPKTERPDRGRRAEQARAAELKAARKAEVDARRAAEQGARQLRAAQEKRDRAASALRDADETLSAAVKHADDAEQAHRRALEAVTSSESH